MQKETQRTVQDTEMKNKKQEAKEALEKTCAEMQCRIQEMVKENAELQNVQKRNSEMHEYRELEEQHAEKQEKIEELEDRCRKLEEQNAKCISDLETIILHNKDQRKVLQAKLDKAQQRNGTMLKEKEEAEHTELEEKHAEKQEKIEELEERCRKLEEQNAKCIIDLETIIIQIQRSVQGRTSITKHTKAV